MGTVGWVVVVVVVLVVVAGVLFAVRASTSKKHERDRHRAAELREQAATQATGVQQHEAQAEDAERAAAAAREQSERAREEAERARAEHAATLEQADRLDPDAPTTAPTVSSTDAPTDSPTHSPAQEPDTRTGSHRSE